MNLTPFAFRRLFDEFMQPSWAAWNSVEDVIFGHVPSDEALVRKLTGRTTLPSAPVSEVWAIVGRGGGKSRFAGRLAAYMACARQYRRVAGESIYIGVFAPDKKQAGVTFKYIAGLIHSVAVLDALVVRETTDSLELSTGIVVEVIAANTAAPRGRAYALVIVEEAAFLPSEEHAADADRELLRAVRPALARVPGSLLAVISSPYAMTGELFRTWQTKFGRDDDAVLVVQGTTTDLNPSFSQREIDRAVVDDPTSASAEYFAQFRNDVSDFFHPATLAACVASGITERAPDPDRPAFAHFDGATGSGEDDAAISLSRTEPDGRAVQVALRRWSPPFSPLSVVEEAAALLHRHRIDTVQGDRFAPGLFADLFRQRGIEYTVAEKDTSAMFIELLAHVNSGSVVLLDDDVLRGQLRGLERRTRPGGQDRVGHRARAHDDVAAACAGSLVLAAQQEGANMPLMLLGSPTHVEYLRARGMSEPDPGPDEGDEIVDMDDATWDAMSADEKAQWEELYERVERTN